MRGPTIFAPISAHRPPIDLTEQFAKAFAEKKRSKNILDYADLEHFALEILVQQEDGRLVRTDAARELSEQFREIMIDEYGGFGMR